MRSLESRIAELRMRWARRQRLRAARLAAPPPVLPERPAARHEKDAQISASTVDGFEIFRVSAHKAPATAGRILYLHGGAYVRPINRHHWNFIVDLAVRVRCEIVVPLYPLAPKHSGSTALDFLKRLHARESADQAPLLLIGDSAGGGLALALAGWIRDSGLPAPRHLVLISPWLDVEIPNPHAAGLARLDPMLTLDGLRRAGRLYAGPRSTADPIISPARGNPAGLPPMSVHVGGRELIEPDVCDFVARARAAGCEIELNRAPAMMHAWPLLGFPEARTARRKIAAQVMAALA